MDDYANILMNLGKSMEKQLTMPKEQFERYRRSDPNKITSNCSFGIVSCFSIDLPRFIRILA
jgi:hypothetical protein